MSPECWSRIRAGDRDAFVELYVAMSRAVFGFCLRRTGSWDAAEDCTSLVFLEAWRLRSTLRQDSSGNAWLFGISHNVVRNSRRAMRRHRALLRRLPLELDWPSVDSEALERIAAAQRARKVADALKRLPERERQILALAASADLTTSELAEALDIPVGTAKSRLHRARQHLAKLMDMDAEHPARVPLRRTTEGSI